MPALPEEEQAIVAVVREFVDRDVRPVARELEHANSYPAQLIERMKQLGVFGLVVPAPYGAVRVSTRCFALVTEELARGWMSLAGAVGGHSVVASLIATFGTERQRERYLPRMATGQLRATMALTEPGGGSDLQAIRTVARRDDARQAGQDSAGYVVNGTKTWITNARRAGLVALLCKTDPAADPAYRGMSILLVEKVPGLTVSRDLPKLGYKGVESCEIALTDCRVPTDPLLGTEEGRGFAQMMAGLELGRIQVAARAARSGGTSRSATTSPIWPRRSPPPGCWSWTLPTDSTPGAAATSRPAWPSCSHPRSPCRSRWTRCGFTADTATPPSST